MSDVTPEQLVAEARKASRNAYAPYSRFGVGAAVLLADGTIVTGANFENASYGLSLCAETVALATVNSQGRIADVVAIGVIGGPIGPDGPTGDSPVSPCGRCRQIINEAAAIGDRDLPVHCGSAQGDAIRSWRISELLPQGFGPRDLL
ncbi:cytidine deaminase [Sphingomonas sp. HF-S3]|uniref:Cytidine deaminase n=2 Tax=Sphingomonas rustica TaxID=3103142 RepID=A0ABV0B5K9_9SPHN